MQELSAFRLNLLRAMYLVIALGMGMQIWPLILNPPAHLEHMRGVVRALMGALSLVALLGVRYPAKMLPLLFFELAWKCIWVFAIGLPLWSAGRLDPGTSETLFACMMGVVVVPLVIPWGYVFDKYLRAPGDRWRGHPA
ncbi:MAG: hypothetical protein ICV87_07340 [Gemmatimonadetes bacterium]|nr:hypothetical protein [Gemmatimonadota bacterium]